jgi:hypothetical protein
MSFVVYSPVKRFKSQRSLKTETNGNDVRLLLSEVLSHSVSSYTIYLKYSTLPFKFGRSRLMLLPCLSKNDNEGFHSGWPPKYGGAPIMSCSSR